jgi:hypothetical protein
VGRLQETYQQLLKIFKKIYLLYKDGKFTAAVNHNNTQHDKNTTNTLEQPPAIQKTLSEHIDIHLRIRYGFGWMTRPIYLVKTTQKVKPSKNEIIEQMSAYSIPHLRPEAGDSGPLSVHVD